MKQLFANAYVVVLDDAGTERLMRESAEVAGEDDVREGRLVKADERQIAQEHPRQAEKFTQ